MEGNAVNVAVLGMILGLVVGGWSLAADASVSFGASKGLSAHVVGRSSSTVDSSRSGAAVIPLSRSRAGVAYSLGKTFSIATLYAAMGEQDKSKEGFKLFREVAEFWGIGGMPSSLSGDPMNDLAIIAENLRSDQGSAFAAVFMVGFLRMDFWYAAHHGGEVTWRVRELRAFLEHPAVPKQDWTPLFNDLRGAISLQAADRLANTLDEFFSPEIEKRRSRNSKP